MLRKVRSGRFVPALLLLLAHALTSVGADGAVGRSDGRTGGREDGKTGTPSDRLIVIPSDRPTVIPSDRLTVHPSDRPTVGPSDSLTVPPTRAAAKNYILIPDDVVQVKVFQELDLETRVRLARDGS